MNRVEVRMSDELYDLAVAESEAHDLTLSEVLAKAFAVAQGKDESTWRLEKGRPGPKPQRRVPLVVNGKNGHRKRAS